MESGQLHRHGCTYGRSHQIWMSLLQVHHLGLELRWLMPILQISDACSWTRVKRCVIEVNIGAGRPATNDLFFVRKWLCLKCEKKEVKNAHRYIPESKVRSSNYVFMAWQTVQNLKILTWSLMSFLCSEDYLAFAIFSIFISLYRIVKYLRVLDCSTVGQTTLIWRRLISSFPHFKE